jgi:hypothetical protein
LQDIDQDSAFLNSDGGAAFHRGKTDCTSGDEAAKLADRRPATGFREFVENTLLKGTVYPSVPDDLAGPHFEGSERLAACSDEPLALH